jgi:hypothetical protein
MYDLIDRDAAIRMLSDYAETQQELDDYRDILMNIPAVNIWIPCSERLPEQDTMVIVCYYGSDCIFPMQGETVTEAVARQNKVPTVTMGFLSDEGWNGADFFPLMVQPSFWMPLPDAPEVIP